MAHQDGTLPESGALSYLGDVDEDPNIQRNSRDTCSRERPISGQPEGAGRITTVTSRTDTQDAANRDAGTVDSNASAGVTENMAAETVATKKVVVEAMDDMTGEMVVDATEENVPAGMEGSNMRYAEGQIVWVRAGKERSWEIMCMHCWPWARRGVVRLWPPATGTFYRISLESRLDSHTSTAFPRLKSPLCGWHYSWMRTPSTTRRSFFF